MADLPKDPKVIDAVKHHLAPGEVVLWAATQRGLGRRGLSSVGGMIFGIVVIAAFSMILNAPGLLLMWLILSSPFLAWWLLEMLTKSFVATDRRVIFRSRVWPHRWSYWNYAELNEHLVRVGSPKRIIHLSLFMMGARGEPSWQYNWAVYPTYIENVPDVEAVRELILEKIRNKPAPVDDSGKPPAQEPQRPYPPVYGTRTG